VCVCSFRYPACYKHAPYYIVISGLSGCTLFATLSHKYQDFRKKLLNIKCVLWLSLQILSDTFTILRRTEWDIIKIYNGFHVKYRYTCEILTKLNFLYIYSRHNKNIKFHENLSSGSQLIPCRRTDLTDWHDEPNWRLSQFFGRS
jgi:hypothetical protein